MVKNAVTFGIAGRAWFGLTFKATPAKLVQLGVSDPLLRSSDFSRSVVAETTKVFTTNCLATYAAAHLVESDYGIEQAAAE